MRSELKKTRDRVQRRVDLLWGCGCQMMLLLASDEVAEWAGFFLAAQARGSNSVSANGRWFEVCTQGDQQTFVVRCRKRLGSCLELRKRSRYRLSTCIEESPQHQIPKQCWPHDPTAQFQPKTTT